MRGGDILRGGRQTAARARAWVCWTLSGGCEEEEQRWRNRKEEGAFWRWRCQRRRCFSRARSLAFHGRTIIGSQTIDRQAQVNRQTKQRQAGRQSEREEIKLKQKKRKEEREGRRQEGRKHDSWCVAIHGLPLNKETTMTCRPTPSPVLFARTPSPLWVRGEARRLGVRRVNGDWREGERNE